MTPMQLAAVSCSLAMLLSLSSLLAQEPAAIRWEDYQTMGVDDRPLHGRLGRLTVLEDRQRPDGATIELAFVRYPSTNPDPGPPIVFLAGGPGGSGIEGCVGPATGRFVRLLDIADVIALDQRGTGLSVPNLHETPDTDYTLPIDRPVQRREIEAAYAKSAAQCLTWWASQGVNLAAYNTENSADDIEDLRVALGESQIVLWGASYGTHLGLTYLRRHGEHVARAVLMRVEGPDHTFKLPSTTQRHLEQLAQLVAADPAWAQVMPDLEGTVQSLLATLDKEHPQVTLERDGRLVSLTLSPFDLQWSLAQTLGLAFQLAAVPVRLQAMTRGDWSGLADDAWDLRHSGMQSGMALAMDTASGASKKRWKLIEREAADPKNVLSDAVNAPFSAAVSELSALDLGERFRTPFNCDVPVLFVSGSLDARTPALNVDEVSAGFSRSTHVIADNAGHESLEMMWPPFQELLKQFLAGDAVEDARFELPSPRFSPPLGV